MITFDYNSRSELDYHQTSVYEFTPIPICFVGARGVGKTSLLASMHYEIKKGGVDSISIDHVNSEKGAETLIALDEAYMDMLDMIEDTEKGQIVQNGGISGSQDLNIYEFIGKYKIEDKSFIRRSDFKEFRFPFHFIDLPGTWYTDNDSHKDEVNEALVNSVASFVAVDTPALMKGVATCERNNKIMKIESWYDNLKDVLAANGHAVIFVLSKAEKYWNDFDGIKQKMEECYGSLITKLKNAGVDVYATKIKTLGGIEFSHYDRERLSTGERADHARFMRTGNYKPENCATPLQLALKHGLVHVAKNLPEASIIDKIGELLGLTNRDIAIESAKALAQDLHDRVRAGEDFSYIKL
ncbi:MAG: ATP-binding protein [Akkermansia sp.]|nr:ATP-binding protein [Akkermansia sp.]